MQTKSGKDNQRAGAGAIESYLVPRGRGRGRRRWPAAIAVVALLAFVLAIAGQGASPLSISVAGFLGTSTPDTAPVPGTAQAPAVTEPQVPPSTPVTSATLPTDPTTVTTTEPAPATTTATTAAATAPTPTGASPVPPPEPFPPIITFAPVSVPPPSARVTLFHVPTPASQPVGLVAGPDGNLWFTEGNRDVVGRVTPEGIITEFHTPTAESQPGGITLGPDGALWFTEMSGNNIGRITTAGAITEFPTPNGSNPRDIASGSDGALWFTDPGAGNVSRMTVDGHMTEYPAGTATPNRITRGADGEMWFTASIAVVGRISSNGTLLSPFTAPNVDGVWAITQDHLGNLWYAGGDQSGLGRIERRDPAGHVTDFVVGRYVEFNGITEGPDGAMWFSESNMNAIGRLAPDGTISTDSAPSPVSIVVGPDANIWFTSGTNGNAVGRIQIG